jgi:hypothetical protein
LPNKKGNFKPAIDTRYDEEWWCRMMLTKLFYARSQAAIIAILAQGW